MTMQTKVRNLFKNLSENILKDFWPLLQAVVGFHGLKNVQIFILLKCLERLLVEMLKQP
jgi:hypothetical protein